MTELTQLIQNLTDLQKREAVDRAVTAQRTESIFILLVAITEASQAKFVKFLEAFSSSYPPQLNIPSSSYHNCPSFESHELESITTGVGDTNVIYREELVEDSVNSELATVFSQNSSNPSEEEEDDSLKLELIPQYFFVETEDVDSLTSMSLPIEEVEAPEIMEFSKLNSVKLDKTCDSKMDSSMDFITHLQLNCKHYSYLRLDFTNSIIDRGKWFDGSVLNDDYKGNFHYEGVLKFGYHIKRVFDDSKVYLLVKNVARYVASKMFVKMPMSIACKLGRGRDAFLVQLKMGKPNNKLLLGKCLFMVINSAPMIYDRGKLFDFLKGYFSLAETYKIGVDTTIFCELVLLGSILKDNYKEEWVYQLVLKHGSQVNWLVATWIIFVSMIITNVESKKWTAAFSETNRLLFFLLARVLRTKRTHKWYFQVLGRKRAGICLLQLTYELPKVIAVQFLLLKYVVESTKVDIPAAEFSCQPSRVLNSVIDHKFSCCIPLWSLNCGVKVIKIPTTAKVPCGESLMTIVARQEGDVLHILLIELKFLLMLIAPVPTIVRTPILFSTVGFFLHLQLLTSHTGESFLIPENTLMADWYSNLMGLWRTFISFTL